MRRSRLLQKGGKRDESLILPLNDSISLTLSQDEMCAKTTVVLSSKFNSDRFWLNHKEEPIDNPRIQSCLKEVRRRASKRKQGYKNVAFIHWHVHIYSVNNFPTAAGLASSAAGYACLVYALSQIFELEGNVSSIARLGSGSACRSLYGGIVRWLKGDTTDGSDSFAEQIAQANHWGDLHVIICVASDGKKKVSSTEGMKLSVKTSTLLKFRIDNLIEKRIELLLKAIKSKDWSSFCDISITDSNEMHAVCLSSFPPCIYMNDTSHSVTNIVHQYNSLKTSEKKIDEKICYTFDAGPNACLFVPGKIVNEFVSILNDCFGQKSSSTNAGTEYWQGLSFEFIKPSGIFQKLICDNKQDSHSMKYFIHTKVGDGPRLIDNSEKPHMLSLETGLPNLNSSRSSVIQSGPSITIP